jgi:3-oxoacyl-[acyl-carrier-protein] synthase-3
MMAIKDAWLQVRAGEHRTAAVTAGEFASRFFRPGHYENSSWLSESGELPLSAEYLRWTLSDGAGAMVLETEPNRRGRSLRIDWVKLTSFADRFDVCMSAGRRPGRGDGEARRPWSQYGQLQEAVADGAFSLWQDFDLLRQMMPAWVHAYVDLIHAGLVRIDAINWFCCHYSTHGLRKELITLMKAAGCMIPEERWFNNLYTRGNTGSASLFLMLEELLNERSLSPGETLLCAVPESGRAIVAFMHLTVV